MRRLTVRIDDDLALALDERVASGSATSLAGAARSAIAEFVGQPADNEAGTRIRAGYGSRPQTPEEIELAGRLTEAMILTEPW